MGTKSQPIKEIYILLIDEVIHQNRFIIKDKVLDQLTRGVLKNERNCFKKR